MKFFFIRKFFKVKYKKGYLYLKLYISDRIDCNSLLMILFFRRKYFKLNFFDFFLILENIFRNVYIC